MSEPFLPQRLYHLWRTHAESPTEARQQELEAEIRAAGFGTFRVQVDGRRWRLEISGVPPHLVVSSES